MSGGKGSKTTTSTTVNPMQQLQMPFVEEGWKQAQNLYNQFSGAPGSSIPQAGEPIVKEGYQNLYNAGQNIDRWMRGPAYGMWTQGGAGMAGSPATPYFQNIANNATTPQYLFAEVGGNAKGAAENYANAIGGYSPYMGNLADKANRNDNLGMSALGQTAQGNFINGNPWFAQMVQNAMDPITRQYQTAIAPQLDASFMNSGRYYSGAMLGQRENAQTTLADQLAKTSSSMYGQNYAQERQNQLAAANQYGQLYNQGIGLGMQGLANAANLQQAAANTYNQGISQQYASLAPQLNSMLQGAQQLQGAYNSGTANQLQAAGLYPNLADAQYSSARNAVLAGQGMNDIQRQYIDEPANLLDRYLKQIGAIQGGSSSTTTPYFTNPMANAMAGITGGLDIANKLGGMGGLGGSQSAFGGYPQNVQGWTTQPGMGLGIYTSPTGITSDQPGSGFPGIPQAAGMAANAAKKI